MRWDLLFADVEAQLEAQERRDLEAEAAGLRRAELARISLAERLAPREGQRLSLRLRDGSDQTGTCVRSASEWVVLVDGPAQVLVPLAAVTWVLGLSAASGPPAPTVRLPLGHALRALARDRAGVRVRVDGGELTGTLDRVGADHMDLAMHPAGQARRPGAVRQVASVRTAALLTVRSTEVVGP